MIAADITMINLIHKPVNNRKNRPTLALDNKALMTACVGQQATTRYKIAEMYWRENKSAPEIAASLGMTVEAVKKIIQRVAKKLKAAEAQPDGEARPAAS